MGCGGEADSREGAGSSRGSGLFVSLSEAEAVIEEGALTVVLVLFAAAPDLLSDPPIGFEVDYELVILGL